MHYRTELSDCKKEEKIDIRVYHGQSIIIIKIKKISKKNQINHCDENQEREREITRERRGGSMLEIERERKK